MIKVTVLVPVYNVEKFLPECLDSLIKQDLGELEILCLDDGSTDSCPKILNDYAEKDRRIRIITKKNTGYGDTMNLGIKEAKGEYIGIVESDDFINKSAFKELYELAKKTDADLVKANYYYYKDGKNQTAKITDQFPHEKALKIEDVLEIFTKEPAIWSCIYKKSFLETQKIEFLKTPGASYQDAGFNFKTLASAKNLTFTDKAYLHYRCDNEGSSVKDQSKINHVVKEFASIEEFLEKRKASREIKEYMQVAKFGSFHWNLNRLDYKLALEFCKTFKKEFRRAEREKKLNKSIFPPKYWNALQLILRFPPRVYVSILRARKRLK